mmetsp:Transcript_3329/g.5013  ORF Transcript_3329/g.5013 Transcript_3329/m.5013 type:complete len:102 (+) Transcript_3329:1100-1405(+)
MKETFSKLAEKTGTATLSSDSATKEELQIAAEKLKRNASLLYMAMKEELPDIFAALVEERDLFMTEAILQSNSQVLVAVVGKGHLPGIQRNLDELGGYKSI